MATENATLEILPKRCRWPSCKCAIARLPICEGAHLKFREDIPTKPCSKRCRGPDDVEADTNQRLSYFSQMYVDDGGYDNAVNSNLFWPQCHLGRTLLKFFIQLIVLIFFSASFHILFLFHFICILTRVPLGGLCHRGQTRIYKI